MIPVKPSYLLVPLVSFALAATLTPVVRRLARRWGFVAKPKTEVAQTADRDDGWSCDLAGGNHDLPERWFRTRARDGSSPAPRHSFFWLD